LVSGTRLLDAAERAAEPGFAGVDLPLLAAETAGIG
jgi:hypothetical protein